MSKQKKNPKRKAKKKRPAGAMSAPQKVAHLQKEYSALQHAASQMLEAAETKTLEAMKHAAAWKACAKRQRTGMRDILKRHSPDRLAVGGGSAAHRFSCPSPVGSAPDHPECQCGPMGLG